MLGFNSVFDTTIDVTKIKTRDVEATRDEYGDLHIPHELKDNIADLDASVLAFCTAKSSDALKSIQMALNKIFPGSTCKAVLYTNNIDKMFFGLNVCPVLPAKHLFDILQSDEPYIVSEYFVEIDSKLVEGHLTHREVSSLILHDVSGLVADATPMTRTKQLLDEYLISTNSVLKYTDSIHYLELLSFGIRDAMRKLTSVFDLPEGECNEFTITCGKNSDIVTAIKKLKGEGKIPAVLAETPIVVLSWVMRLYNSILKFRIAARHTLKKGIKFTGSVLDKREMENILRRLDRIDDDAILREGTFDELMSAIGKQLHDMKVKGISKYEDDFYTLQFDANNIETQEDALLLLHRVNSRMAVIADFLSSEQLTTTERSRWSNLINQYNTIRNQVSKQKIYQNKTRLYVNYGYDD